MARWIVSLRPVRKLGKPRIENGMVFCNYCDYDEETCVVSYPGGERTPACVGCALATIGKGDRVEATLPGIFLCTQGKNKIVVTLAESD